MAWQAWNRKLWGVEMTSKLSDPVLIGELWNPTATQPRHVGEPTRALLFCTRRDARAWAKDYQAKCTVKHWRFRAVPVRETVRKSR